MEINVVSALSYAKPFAAPRNSTTAHNAYAHPQLSYSLTHIILVAVPAYEQTSWPIKPPSKYTKKGLSWDISSSGCPEISHKRMEQEDFTWLRHWHLP